MDCVGSERAAPVRTLVQKRAGGTFLARGRFHGAWSAAGKAVKQAPLFRLLLCIRTGVFSLWRKGNRTDQMQQPGGLLPARA